MQRTTFSGDVTTEMPDLRGITIDTSILIDCVNQWRMNSFEGPPPDPHEVVMRNTAQQEVVIMANFIEFVRDEPKRMKEIQNMPRLGDITHVQ